MVINTITFRKALPLIGILLLSIGVGASKINAAEDKASKHWEMSQQYMENGDYQSAVVELKNVIQLTPQNQEAHYALGECYLNLGKKPEAFASFWDVVGLNPLNLRAHLKLGELYMHYKNTIHARYHAQEIIKSAPDNDSALTLLVNVLVQERDYKNALVKLKRIISIYPNDLNAHLMMGSLYLTTGDFDNAEAAYIKAASIDPDTKQTLIKSSSSQYQSLPVLARSLEENNKWNEAEKVYLELINRSKEKVAPLKQIAAFYTRTGSYEKALSSLERAYSIRDELDIILQIAVLHYKFNNMKDAEAKADQVLKYYQNQADANILKGKIYLRKKNSKKAIKHLDLAVKINPRNADAQHFRGMALMELNEIDKAKEALETAVAVNPDLLNARLTLATLYIRHLNEGELAIGKQQIGEVLKQDPSNKNALVLQGQLFLRKRNFQGAAAAFQKVIQKHPDYAPGYVNLGLLFYRTGRQEEALSLFEKTIELDPSKTGALTIIVTERLKKSKFDEALKICTDQKGRLAHNPYLSGYLENLMGRIFLAKRDFEKAREHFEKSVALAPNLLSSHMALTKLYLINRDVNEVIAHFENQLTDDPEFMVGYMVLGTIHYKTGEKEKAESYFRKALEVDEDFAPAANNLAWCLAEGDKDMNEALELAEIAKNAMPNDPQVLHTLGWIYYKLGYLGKAIDQLEACITVRPEIPLYNYHLAKAFNDNKQFDKAKEYFEKALAINSSFKGAEDARRYLEKYRSLK